jgi:hypothetical protein
MKIELNRSELMTLAQAMVVLMNHLLDMPDAEVEQLGAAIHVNLLDHETLDALRRRLGDALHEEVRREITEDSPGAHPRDASRVVLTKTEED